MRRPCVWPTWAWRWARAARRWHGRRPTWSWPTTISRPWGKPSSRGAASGGTGGAACGSSVAAQLAQTLDAGWTEGRLSSSVLGAVGGSAGMLVSALTVGPLRNLLGLAAPGPVGWGLIGTVAAASVVLNRILSSRR